MEKMEQKNKKQLPNETKENNKINALLYYFFYQFLFLEDIKSDPTVDLKQNKYIKM